MEKHYGEGEGTGERILNPVTNVEMEEGSSVRDGDSSSCAGVASTDRDTNAVLGEDAKLVHHRETALTHGDQTGHLEHERDRAQRQRAQACRSSRAAWPRTTPCRYSTRWSSARLQCRGHVQCDAIIMGSAKVKAIPGIEAASEDAMLDP